MPLKHHYEVNVDCTIVMVTCVKLGKHSAVWQIMHLFCIPTLGIMKCCILFFSTSNLWIWSVVYIGHYLNFFFLNMGSDILRDVKQTKACVFRMTSFQSLLLTRWIIILGLFIAQAFLFIELWCLIKLCTCLEIFFFFFSEGNLFHFLLSSG